MRNQREAGFTLLELMVALLLLGLISTLALGGVQLGARTWETVAVRAGDTGRAQMVRAFLTREIGQAVPVYLETSGRDKRLAYEGVRDSLRFVAPLAPHFGLGGYQHLELAVVDDPEGGDAGKRLVLKRRQFHRDEDPGADVEDQELHVLLEGIEEAEFSYRGGGPEDTGGWSLDWRDRKLMPTLVRLRINFRDGRRATWPDLLVAQRITSKPGCFSGDQGPRCRNG